MPGEGGQDGPERARRAADALAAAKADARARGERAPARDFAAKRMAGGDRPAGRRRREDPQPLGVAIEGLLDDQGWRTSAAVGSVFGRWEQIVGEALAAHTRPGGFTDGELLVIADSTAWATQVWRLRSQLPRRLHDRLGDGTRAGLRVRSPMHPRQRR